MASFENVIVADDDVMYEPADVERMCELLRDSDLVVPQNFFRPLPWWARLESGRICSTVPAVAPATTWHPWIAP
jgi:hypothetical protein